MKAKITKRLVDGLSAGESEIWIADTETKGFGLRVHPTGAKVYLLRYRVDGQQRKKTIGEHGSPWTPEMARKEALKLLGQVVSGIDPLEEQEAARKDVTVKEMCETYLKKAEAGKVIVKRGGVRRPKKASSVASDRSMIEAHIVPLLGKKNAQKVTKADLERFRDKVTEGDTERDRKTRLRGRSIVKGGPIAATRALATLSAIYTHADLPTGNPVRGVATETSARKVTSLSPEDYEAIHKALLKVENDSGKPEENKGTKIALQAIRALLLTGCRRNEIASLKKAEVDPKDGCLRLTDTKTNAQVRPIGKVALDLILAQDWDEKDEDGNTVKESEFVFPASRGNGHIVGVQKVWAKVRKSAGLEGVTLHTARHGFASVAAELGFTEFTIAGLLGHSSGSVTSRYTHIADTALVAAANRIAAVIDARMKGDAKTEGNVVRMTATQ